MVCNSHNNHSPSCPSYKNNSLKGASAVNNQSKKLMFFSKEIDIISKILEISRFYITKNKDQFQQPKDILKDVNSAMSLLDGRKNNKKIYLLKK